MQKGHQRCLGRRMPWPAGFDCAGVGAAFRLHHIGVQTTFKGTTAQTGQDLIAQVAPAQVNMLRLQQQSPSEGASAIPHASNRPCDQAEGATRRLELGDIGQALSEEPDEFGMKGIPNTHVLREIRLEGSAVDRHTSVALGLVVGHVGARHLGGMRGVHRIEESAGEHRSALIRLRRGEIAGLTGSSFRVHPPFRGLSE